MGRVRGVLDMAMMGGLLAGPPCGAGGAVERWRAGSAT